MSHHHFETNLSQHVARALLLCVAGCGDSATAPRFHYVLPEEPAPDNTELACAHDQRFVICTTSEQTDGHGGTNSSTIVVVDTLSQTSKYREVPWRTLPPIVVGRDGGVTPLILGCAECSAVAPLDAAQSRCDRGQAGAGGAAGVGAGGDAGHSEEFMNDVGGECTRTLAVAAVGGPPLYSAFGADGEPCCFGGTSRRLSSDAPLRTATHVDGQYDCEANESLVLAVSSANHCGDGTPLTVRYEGDDTRGALTFNYRGRQTPSESIEKVIRARVDAYGENAFAYSEKRLVVYRAQDEKVHTVWPPELVSRRDARRSIKTVDFGCPQRSACRPTLLFIEFVHEEGTEQANYAVVRLDATPPSFHWGGATTSGVADWDIDGAALAVSFTGQANDGRYPMHWVEVDGDGDGDGLQLEPIEFRSGDAISALGVLESTPTSKRGYLLHSDRDGALTVLDWRTRPPTATSITGFLLPRRIQEGP